ncbi:hypothetical protein M3231_25085 [Neobacillus mesonae]|nr:hypothetical protein [Neobacillus mesonae]
MKSNHHSKRTRGYYRHHRQRVIERKKKLIEDHLGWHVPNCQFGRLSKSKIHCSCSMCSEKSRHLGFPKSALTRIESQMEQLRELN